MKHGDAEPTRMTDCNPWLADFPLAPQEIVKYKARDGLELEGILMHPIDERAGGKYPLILCVHGGPEAHERNGWLTNYSRPGQVASSSGYFTFYPNYRGSTGRGVAFSKMGQGDEAGKEFDDLVDAVEYLAGKFPVDKSKVGVTGGSYGGFATAWCSTALSEHFAAGVMFVGISDTIGKKGTTDIPNEDYLVHTRSRPWEDKWEFYLQRSPIYHVKKAKTPLLIMGGKADTRVHPSQSIELYHFLKSLGQVPVRLVQFPGEGHGNRKAALKLDYNIRMMQWFDQYLKGSGGPPPPGEVEYGIKEKAAEEKK
jgi:dipeptidyl aminopeptidase/acylaminoacyl peptidase